MKEITGKKSVTGDKNTSVDTSVEENGIIQANSIFPTAIQDEGREYIGVKTINVEDNGEINGVYIMKVANNAVTKNRGHPKNQPMAVPPWMQSLRNLHSNNP